MGGDPEGKSFIPLWVVTVGHCFSAAGPCCRRGEGENDIEVGLRNCNRETGKDGKVSKHCPLCVTVI